MSVNRLTLLPWFLLTGVLLATPMTHAQAPEPGVQSLAGIRAAAEKALRATIDASLPGVALEAAALDARLRLSACAAKLETFAAAPRNAQSRVPVRVSCSAPAWTVNVPVEVHRSHAVLVLRRAVGRGETIAPADVVVQSRTLPGLATPFVSSTGQLTGRLTRRPIPEGTALTADALSVALLIHRGQQVTLLALANGFEVRAPGRAMADAAAHQRVRVQNLNSLKIVEGMADNDGVVRVLP
jgi:flagella basal body P-ring formation protein FlgA